MPKISVIVPVYKVEKYLKRCVDSILSQTFTDFELILVDDGSPDNSGKICDEYKKKDNRIVVIHKENGGVSAARNDGIKFAQGEYIVFIDSDDFVNEKFLEILFHENVDLVCQNAAIFNENSGLVEKNYLINCNNISFDKVNISVLNELIFNSYCDTVWGKLFKKEIIVDNNICFDETMCNGEDTLFSVNYAKFSKKIMIENVSNYYYVKFDNRDTLSKNIVYDLNGIKSVIKKISDSASYGDEINREFMFTHLIAVHYNRMIWDEFNFLLFKNFKKNLKFLLKIQKDKDFLLCLKYDDLIALDKSIKNEMISGSKISVFCKYTYLQFKQCFDELRH